MFPAPTRPRRPVPAALTLCFGALIALSSQVSAQEATQPPAPIVRPRPRPQTVVPASAPPDAAPLVNRATRPRSASTQVPAPAEAAPLAERPPRPRPVNPQALGGAAASTGTASGKATHPPAAGTAASGTASRPQTGAASPASTGVLAPPRPRPAAATPSTTAAQGGSPVEHTATPKAAPLSTTLNRSIIVLDPAHGAQDSGSRIGDKLLEKDVDLAFAFRLRSFLAARGFTVVLTRDSDAALNAPANSASSTPGTPLTLDDRAGIANHYRPAACLLLHATGRGTGVHLYTSALDATYGEPSLLPWLTAQSAWVPASQQLETSLSSALGRSHLALLSSAASIRPVDSLTCPALVLELAPENDDARSITDTSYQDRIAAAIAGALIFWQNQVQAPAKLPSTTPSSRTTPHSRNAVRSSTEVSHE